MQKNDEIPAGYLQRKTAAKYIGQCGSQLDGYRRDGEIPYYRISSKLVLFRRSDLDRFMERFRVDASEPSPHETKTRGKRGRYVSAKGGGE